jgi:hypothetical protein
MIYLIHCKNFCKFPNVPHKHKKKTDWQIKSIDLPQKSVNTVLYGASFTAVIIYIEAYMKTESQISIEMPGQHFLS